MFAAVIALNAYSTFPTRVSNVRVVRTVETEGGLRTNLVEATLIREDGNVSVEACAACSTLPIS